MVRDVKIRVHEVKIRVWAVNIMVRDVESRGIP
jgi:hypothetical protein